MIQSKKINEPQFLKSNNIKNLRNEISSHYVQPKELRRQTKFPVDDLSILLRRQIGKDLLTKTNGKCIYCETTITENNINLDHFRPHYAAANSSGKISQDHYWWLALKWNNLYPSCEDCNRYKRNYFPVYRKRAKDWYSAKVKLYNIEEPIFIDPEYENPEQFFSYKEDGTITSETERGRITIELLNLNRTSLIEARRKVAVEVGGDFLELSLLIDDINKSESIGKKPLQELRDLEKYFDFHESPFLGIRRFFIRKFLDSKEYKSSRELMPTTFKRKLKISLKKGGIVQDSFSDLKANFNIDSISIKNYKSINEINIRFNRTSNKKAGWAILIGENGVGKSSILAATLKTLIGRNYNYLSFNENEINRESEFHMASIKLGVNDLMRAEVQISKRAYYFHQKDYFLDQSIMAFGPFKHSHKSDKPYNKFKKGCFVDNFFKPSTPLHSPSRFLLQLSNEQFEYVSIALLDLFMLEGKAKIHRKLHTDELWIQHNDTNRIQKFEELSDGYLSVLTLGCNIIEGLLLNNESIENASGFVVIDEIGANLHPRWKMQIVKRLRRTFRNVQFLVTTHDPLCLKGIEKDETYVLRQHNGKLQVLTDLPNPSELRADQLLTSEFFGLYSTIDPDIEKEFKEYYELLYDKDKTAADKNRLDKLKKELREKNHLGDSLREELLYVAIDTILAEHKKSDEPFSRKKVEKEVKEKAIELIDEFLADLET